MFGYNFETVIICWPLLLFFAFILYTFSSSSYYACLWGKLKMENVRWLRTRWGDCSFLFNLPVNIIILYQTSIILQYIIQKIIINFLWRIWYVGSISVEGLMQDLAWERYSLFDSVKVTRQWIVSLRNILRENLG